MYCIWWKYFKNGAAEAGATFNYDYAAMHLPAAQLQYTDNIFFFTISQQEIIKKETKNRKVSVVYSILFPAKSSNVRRSPLAFL
jgi:hypothetical protein